SSAFLPASGASANNSRSSWIFSWALWSCFGLIAVCVCVGIVVFSLVKWLIFSLLIQLGGHLLLAEHFCQVLRLVALLMVHEVAKYRRLPIDLLPRTHDAAEWPVLFRHAPRGYRNLVHPPQIVFPTDILLWQPQFRDGHERRKALGPHYRRFLNRHFSQVRAHLDLYVELVRPLTQLRYKCRTEDLLC